MVESLLLRPVRELALWGRGAPHTTARSEGQGQGQGQKRGPPAGAGREEREGEVGHHASFTVLAELLPALAPAPSLSPLSGAGRVRVRDPGSLLDGLLAADSSAFSISLCCSEAEAERGDRERSNKGSPPAPLLLCCC